MNKQEGHLKKKYRILCYIIYGLILVHPGIRAQDITQQHNSPLMKEYHVAKNGSDANTGTSDEPFLTIQKAASMAQPGTLITVHKGVYRERVNPPRGGSSDDMRIVYQAAPNEKVVIKGSELIKDWKKKNGDLWEVTIPNSFFGEFNPYSDTIYGHWFQSKNRTHHTGAVYLNKTLSN